MSIPKGQEDLYLPDKFSSEITANLLAEMGRKQDSRLVSTEAYDLDEIIKISFICGCHGSIISSFRDIESEGKFKTLGASDNKDRDNEDIEDGDSEDIDNEDIEDGDSEDIDDEILWLSDRDTPTHLMRPIPSHGKYTTINTNSEISLCGIPFQFTDVEYKIDNKPVLEFNYQDIDTTHLNVLLTTSGSCGGAVVYRGMDPLRVGQKFVNDIMEEIEETCPTNNVFSEKGVYGDTFSTTHKNYKLQQRELKKIEQTRRKDAARRIERLYKKSRKLMFPLRLFDSEIDHLKKNMKSNMYGKTRLMKYEKERVGNMLNKKYTTKVEEVYADKLTTRCDAYKLIMIVTRNTAHGCKSQKYTLLSSLAEVQITIRKLRKDFSPSIGKLYSGMASVLQPKSGGIAMATTRLSLIDMLGLGKSIIEEINGEGASRTVPINIYDSTCNSFNSLPSNYAYMNSKTENGLQLNNRVLSIIRIIDDYFRAKGVALGGKAKKHI